MFVCLEIPDDIARLYFKQHSHLLVSIIDSIVCRVLFFGGDTLPVVEEISPLLMGISTVLS
jgi:hypothetical protein